MPTLRLTIPRGSTRVVIGSPGPSSTNGTTVVSTAIRGRSRPRGHRGPLPGGLGEDAGRCVRGAPQPGERHAGPTLPRALPSRENALLGDFPISGSPEGTWWSGTSGRWRTLDERFLGPPHLPPLLKEQRAPALRLPLATPPPHGRLPLAASTGGGAGR